MNKKHIQDLLDKYFAGETSLREETELKKFFHKTALLPEEWKSYKQLFAYFETEGKKTMPANADIPKKKNIVWMAGVGMSIAAAALILLMVFKPATKDSLHPTSVAVTTQPDSADVTKTLTQKSFTLKTAQLESKKRVGINRDTILKTLIVDTLKMITSGIDEKPKDISIATIINETLTPLDNMEAFNKAMDQFKYFNLLNQYLPDQDFASIFSNY